jgi:hypothetical protein
LTVALRITLRRVTTAPAAFSPPRRKSGKFTSRARSIVE